ncbi:MAG: IMPACT family protein [Evtepia gabavorous]
MAEYYVPARDSETEFTEKRSRFIGHVWRVEQEEEAREKIAQMKAKHYDARHNCWCYLIREGGIIRYSDDGEPQGTAGQPMLEVFRRAGVENVCCVVTRYFGGILLGTGGLLRAYTRSAKDALDAAGIAQVRQWAQTVECPYPCWSGSSWRLPPPRHSGEVCMAPRSACPPCCLWSTGGLRGPDHGTDRRQDRGGEAGETFQAAGGGPRGGRASHFQKEPDFENIPFIHKGFHRKQEPV